MKILVGSKNPVKINAVQLAFKKYFENIEVICINVSSDVPAQPKENDTFKGAENRASKLYKQNSEENLNTDFFVGIEGGISKVYERWFGYGCMCIMDSYGRNSFGTSPHFELPKPIIDKLLNGIELGDVIDEITRKNNTKQKSGAIGFLTKEKMSRENLYTHGLVTALVPSLNIELYFN